jgi:hypothetical protein
MDNISNNNDNALDKIHEQFEKEKHQYDNEKIQ